MRLAVLNPRGRDPEQSFSDFAGAPNAHSHPPVNHHGYAACTGGGFYRSVSALPQGRVLLLVRRDLRLCLKTLGELKKQGRTVAVAVKECGLFQVGELLAKAGGVALFGEICAGADACLASTPELAPLLAAAGGRRVEFIPTPYPVEDARWDFSAPAGRRKGIFIGTREFGVPSRNHLAALLCARAIASTENETVTVINSEGAAGRRALAGLGFAVGRLRVVEGKLPYPDYLRLMAAHRLVFQLDRGAVPGQVAGDALLCGMPCAGGDGAIDRLVFPELTGKNTGQTLEIVKGLLADPVLCERRIEESRAAARKLVSFTAVAERLRLFFGK